VNLTEFLLARIAEDAARAEDLESRRSLADCEAKRRIVRMHQPPTICGWDCRDGRCPTLRALALPYADHPDYREEWKP
jgi:hypothetical protein